MPAQPNDSAFSQWGQIYNDDSILDKDGIGPDSQVNTTGCLITAGPVYTSVVNSFSTLESPSYGFSMGGEAFDVGQADDVGRFAAEGLLAVVNETGLLDEVVH